MQPTSNSAVPNNKGAPALKDFNMDIVNEYLYRKTKKKRELASIENSPQEVYGLIHLTSQINNKFKLN
jgi:hypothetical protein